MISHKDFQAFLKLETVRRLRVKNELEKEINNWLNEQMNEKYLKIEYV